MHNGAVKYDDGKSPVTRGCLQYFPRALAEVAKVSDFGSEKYAWDGWRYVKDGINRYSNAEGRHLIDEGVGCMNRDKDSSLLTAAHTAWNALAKLELILQEIEEDARVDTRPGDNDGEGDAGTTVSTGGDYQVYDGGETLEE